MALTLPLPHPDAIRAAYAAAADEAWTDEAMGLIDGPISAIDAAMLAAWPHLFATALRYAAAKLPSLAAHFLVATDENERLLVEWCADRLDRMADEVTA